MTEKDPATWQRIRLELARSHNHPEGSTRFGYVLMLPLDADGRVDEPALRKASELATVHRFWENEDDATGRIMRRGPKGWVFAYGGERADDEPVPHLSDHVFAVGQYLAVRESSGREHVLRVVAIEPAPGLVPTPPRIP